MSVRNHWTYRDGEAVLTSMHAKASVIAPVMRDELGLIVDLANGVDNKCRLATRLVWRAVATRHGRGSDFPVMWPQARTASGRQNDSRSRPMWRLQSLRTDR